ncbi:MAG: GEVED domain-containing protein, partial [candidate division Zixibacteria bacterium]|nr:GEVED domain-containing protein [candidate division Zixibacteria bacterium]
MSKRKPSAAAKWVVTLIMCALLCPILHADDGDWGGRSLPPVGPPDSVDVYDSDRSYCPSYGGSHQYESIASVTTIQTDQTMTITVNIWIANPTGCTSGSPCPEYDNSPEYVNAWIDWDGDEVWESHERVMDVALSGYVGINYQGTMTAVAQVTVPPGAVATTMLRANLGWDYDPNDPCAYSWTWGDAHTQSVTVESSTIKVREISIS